MATAVETMHGLTNTLRKYSESTGIVGIASLDDAIKSVSTSASLDEFRSQFVKDVTIN